MKKMTNIYLMYQHTKAEFILSRYHLIQLRTRGNFRRTLCTKREMDLLVQLCREWHRNHQLEQKVEQLQQSLQQQKQKLGLLHAWQQLKHKVNDALGITAWEQWLLRQLLDPKSQSFHAKIVLNTWLGFVIANTLLDPVKAGFWIIVPEIIE